MIVLALENLRDTCVSRFADERTFGGADDTEARALAERANPFGWREPPRQLVAPGRIVWVPGDTSGALGEIVGPRHPGPHVTAVPITRPLAGLWELFTCDVVGADVTPGKANDERAQYHAARLLYDAWLRAVHLAAVGNYVIKSQTWVEFADTPNERRYGAAIRVVGAILAVIPDAPLVRAEPPLAADVTVTDLDVSETEHITP